jgi:type IV secretion system protein VirB9
MVTALTGCVSLKQDRQAFVPAVKEKVVQQKEPVIRSSSPRPLIGENKRVEDKTSEDLVRDSYKLASYEPEEKDFIYAMTVYDFMPYTLYKVYCMPGRVTDIVLAHGEALIDISAGDTVRWQVNSSLSGQGEDERIHVLVKPIKSGISNNIVILTNLHTYYLEASSTQESYQSAVSWNYPRSFIKKREKAQKEPDTNQSTVIRDASRLTFTYEIKDTRRWWTRLWGKKVDWQPVRVFDDSTKTFIQFPPDVTSSEAPALFVVSSEGTTQVVNYRISGTYYIVDRVFDRAKLVVGEQHPTIIEIRKKS